MCSLFAISTNNAAAQPGDDSVAHFYAKKQALIGCKDITVDRWFKAGLLRTSTRKHPFYTRFTLCSSSFASPLVADISEIKCITSPTARFLILFFFRLHDLLFVSISFPFLSFSKTIDSSYICLDLFWSLFFFIYYPFNSPRLNLVTALVQIAALLRRIAVTPFFFSNFYFLYSFLFYQHGF